MVKILNCFVFAFMFSRIKMESEHLNGKTTGDPRPIIGILAQATERRTINKFGRTFISASYVKLIESGGARVVPIFVNQTEDYYRKIFNSINGVVFPGGGSKVFQTKTGVGRSAAYMYAYAKESFLKGDYFPVFGICFGFELLAMLTDSFSCLTTNLSASDISLPLNFTPGYKTSRMFRSAPSDVISILSSQNVTFNAHKKGVTSATFYQNHNLNSFYQPLSTNKDLNGLEFISSMEAYDYPIYGTQWHPEKNPFEWNLHSGKNIPHSMDAVRVSQYIADFIVSEARKSSHSFSSPEEEQKALIYNYQPYYTGDIYIMEQCYVFK